MAVDVQQYKQAQRRVWSSGDYPDIATYIQSVSDLIVDRLGISDGDELLDVATGSGNLAIAAAGRGAAVTGLDLTPELLVAARARAADEGVEVNWIEGDAEELPFAADSFDAVPSVFGVMFVPRHRQGASELVRVTRPGGKIAFAAWTPEGVNGVMFKTIGSHMPPPPPELKPPIMWGDEDYARSLFADLPVELSITREMVRFEEQGDVEQWMSQMEETLGPIIMAKSMLEPQGKWDPLKTELLDLYRNANQASDGSISFDAEYLIGIGEVTG